MPSLPFSDDRQTSIRQRTYGLGADVFCKETLHQSRRHSPYSIQRFFDLYQKENQSQGIQDSGVRTDQNSRFAKTLPFRDSFHFANCPESNKDGVDDIFAAHLKRVVIAECEIPV